MLRVCWRQQLTLATRVPELYIDSHHVLVVPGDLVCKAEVLTIDRIVELFSHQTVLQ